MSAAITRTNADNALRILSNAGTSAKPTDPVPTAANQANDNNEYWTIVTPKVGQSANSVLYAISGNRPATISFANDPEPAAQTKPGEQAAAGSGAPAEQAPAQAVSDPVTQDAQSGDDGATSSAATNGSDGDGSGTNGQGDDDGGLGFLLGLLF